MEEDDCKLIITALLDFIYNVLDSILSTVSIPDLDQYAKISLFGFLYWLENAKPLIGLVFPIDMNNYFSIFFGIFAFDKLYPVIMWILRKIPMLGIE